MSRRDVQSATSLRRSPLDDRKRRLRQYSIAMSVRTICLIGVVFLPGWWRLVFGIGAVVLPWIAVVLANVGAAGASTPVSPGTPLDLQLEAPREPLGSPGEPDHGAVPADRMLVEHPR